MIAVSNSTALMHLSAMGRLDLLPSLFGQVHIPAAVYEEVVGRGAGRPGAAEVAGASWIERCTVANQLAVDMLRADLQAGEAECIVLAAELGADLLILDDGAARLAAIARGVPVVGTVGILLRADNAGLISFPEALDALVATGFRLRAAECERVLAWWKAQQPHAG